MFIFYVIYFIGIAFLTTATFSKNTPMGGGGGGMASYRSRGGIVAALFLILWLVVGFIFISSEDFKILELAISSIVGGLIGFLLWKLFIKYNKGKPGMPKIGPYRKITKNNLIPWTIASLIISLFFLFLGFALSGGNLIIGIITYIIFVPIVALLGARINWF